MERVFIYRNVRRRCWSIRSEGGRNRGVVVAHADEVLLTNCTFKVSEAGRQRVLRERRKHVHAGVSGLLRAYRPFGEPSVSGVINPDALSVEVHYRPYAFDKFFTFGNQRAIEPILTSPGAYFDNEGKLFTRFNS